MYGKLIRCSERLPEKGKMVAVVNADGTVGVDCYYPEFGWGTPKLGFRDPDDAPTHWHESLTDFPHGIWEIPSSRCVHAHRAMPCTDACAGMNTGTARQSSVEQTFVQTVVVEFVRVWETFGSAERWECDSSFVAMNAKLVEHADKLCTLVSEELGHRQLTEEYLRTREAELLAHPDRLVGVLVGKVYPPNVSVPHQVR